MGVSVATHYCGGHAVKSAFTLNDADLDCGMKNIESSCESSSNEASFVKRNCCDNQYVSIHVDDNIQSSLVNSDLDVKFLFTFLYAFNALLPANFEQEVAYEDYAPPIRNLDTQVLFQTFLI